jgi:hypothetical protein
MLLTAQRAQEVPLKNWVTPQYWQPNQAEREAAAKNAPQLQFSTNAVSTNALTFVAITPCRLMDTRGIVAGFNGIAPFSGPSIPSGVTVPIPVQSSAEAIANTTPAPCGTIPSTAQAYSLNLTVVPAVGGSVDYVSLWQGGTARPFISIVDDPQGAIVSNAAIVAAGTIGGGIDLFNDGPSMTDVVIDMNGYFAPPSDLNGNTALGTATLENNTTGTGNTASGVAALFSNTTGANNTANGDNALSSNTTGAFNMASGYQALLNNTSGSANTASGPLALLSNTVGANNTASGGSALYENTTGMNNTALGDSALEVNTTGSNNIAVGYQAATGVSGGNSNNIIIGSPGVFSDGTLPNSGVIRIGTAGTQTSFFAAGINNGPVLANPVAVLIDTGTGQLSIATSSERFKEDIQDMGDASSGLLSLRPVTFRYKRPLADGSKPIEYGLIAEEVADVYPELVAHSADGHIETVKYQVLDSMLLNEVQKQAEQLRQQTERNRSLEERIAALEALLPKPSGPVR